MLTVFKQIIRNVTPKFIIRGYHYLVALAAAILYRFPSRELYIIGVTGTKGKSSTVEIINAILEEAGYKTALASTIRFKIGNHSEPNRLKMTMAGRGYLQKFLREAVKAGCTHAILEMTSEGTLLYRHAFIDLNAFVFTNLSPEHIESHGSYEHYLAAKLKIRDRLLVGSKTNRLIVVNNDDKEAARFLDTPSAKQAPFSIEDVKPYTLQPQGSIFNFKGEYIQTHLPGLFNIYNILAASTLASELGIATDVIKQAVEKFHGIPGRMERIKIHTDKLYPTVIVDYAHTADSLTKAYEAWGGSRLVCVLGGTGGGRDKWKRPVMGTVADQYCSHIILTDEDPYDENPKDIVDQIAAGIKNKPYEVVMDRRAAIAKAVSLAAPTDIVIITGKGTDPYIMGPHGNRLPWSDSEVAKDILEKHVAVE